MGALSNSINLKFTLSTNQKALSLRNFVKSFYKIYRDRGVLEIYTFTPRSFTKDSSELIAVSAAVSAWCAEIHQQRKRVKLKSRQIQPSLRRASLIHPESTTAWHQILSFGTSADFIVYINFE